MSKVESYYQYAIDVTNYETRETFDIAIFKDKFGYRRALKTYERWYGSEERYNWLIEEVRKGGSLLIVYPKKHIKGWCLLSAKGIVKGYSIGKWLLYNKLEKTYLARFFYACLNRAVDINLPCVKFRIPIKNWRRSKLIESYLEGLGCDVTVTAKYY